MAKYLHIFEDGSIKSVSEEPTEEDRDCIDAGILTVIKFENGEFLDLQVDNTWIKL